MRQNKTFVKAAQSAFEGSDEERQEDHSTNEGDDSNKLSVISEGNEEQSSDEHIKIEVPIENQYYEEEGNKNMFGMRTYDHTKTSEMMKHNTEDDYITATVMFLLKGNKTLNKIKTWK